MKRSRKSSPKISHRPPHGVFNMRYIHYILLGDKTENYTIRGKDHRILVSVFAEQDIINFPGWCGTRQHEVYVDGALNRKKYRDFINEIVKPELCFRDSNPSIYFI